MPNIGSLTAILGLNNTQFLTGIAASKTQMLGLSKSLSKLAVPALVIGGAIALAKGISRATDAAAKLEKTMANVATLVDKPKEEILALTREVQNMTTEVLKSSEDLSAGLYQIFSAGITDSADALEVLRVSAIAATAGLSDTRTSVDAITTIINAYGLEARKATHISDLLFQTVRLGKTTYDELAGAIGTVTSIAATAGVELTDLFGIIATLTKGGIRTKRATFGLRALLLSIIKPSDGAIKKAKELGLAWNIQAVRARGLTGFINDMRDAVNGSEEAITELVPSARALNVVMALTGKQNQELNRIMGEFGDISGTTAEAFKKQANTVEGQSTRMGLAIDRLTEKFGGLFLSIKKITVTGIAFVFEQINRDIEEAAVNSDRLAGFIDNITKSQRLRGKGIDLPLANVQEFIDALKIADIDLVQFFSKTIEEQRRLIPALGLPSSLIPKDLKLGLDNLVKDTEKAADEIIKTWARTSDEIKKAFEDLGIVPKAQFDDVIKDTIKSFEIVGKELGKRGELNVETATKLRQKLIDKLKGLSEEAAKSGFIIDDEQLRKLEISLDDFGDSAVRTAQNVIREINKETGALEITIKKGVFETDKFIADTAKGVIESFKDTGLDITEILKNDFAVLADSHVQKWTFTRDQLQNLDISYTDSFLGELKKRGDGFAAFARAIEIRAAEIRRNIESFSAFEGQTITIPIPPTFHRGALSVPQTGLANVEKGELIIPAEQNPFNDNRTFNNTFNMGSQEDEFTQRQSLQRLIDKNRNRVSI